MANVKFKLNYQGVRELLQSDRMKSICEEYANAALGRLGDGYEVTSQVGETRVNAEVAAVTHRARKENLENNTILKSLRG